jgi:nucleoside phosphorylase
VAERGADVMVVVALRRELDAILKLGLVWEECESKRGFPYHRRTLVRPNRPDLSLAAVWTGGMGQVATATSAVEFIDELEPGWLAMCGICAGLRGEVALGDVVVASRVFIYDAGKMSDRELLPDPETYPLPELWRIRAQYFAERAQEQMGAFVASRPVSKEAQRRWLLESLYRHEVEGAPPPTEDILELKARCPSWSTLIAELRDLDNLRRRTPAWFPTSGYVSEGATAERLEPPIDPRPDTLQLTETGRRIVRAERIRFPFGLPRERDFAIHIAPIATGSAVQQDPGLFGRLRRQQRKTLAVEMESAAVASVAARLNRNWIVAKAISDYADYDKDDAFHDFACEASARFLLGFLERYVEPTSTPTVAPRPPRGAGKLRYLVPRPLATLDRSRHAVARGIAESVALASDPNGDALVIRAAPGLGKTTTLLETAVELAGHASIQRRYDMMVWLPAGSAQIRGGALRQVRPMVSSLQELLAMIAGAIERHEIGTLCPTSQLMAVYTAMAERPLVLLIDDLDAIWTPDVEAFFRHVPAGTTVVATSTQELHFGRTWELAALSPEAIARITAARFPGWESRWAGQRDEVLAAASGNPQVALYLLARLTFDQRASSIANIIEQTDVDIIDHLAAPIVEHSGLSAAERLSVAALSFYTGDLPQSLVARLLRSLEGGADSIATFLPALEKRGIVFCSDRDGLRTYRVQPFVRRFLLHSSPMDSSRRVAFARAHIDEVSHALRVSQYKYAFPQLDAQNSADLQILHWASVDDDSELRLHGAQLLCALSPYLHFRGRWDALIEHANWACESLVAQHQLREAAVLGGVWTARCLFIRGEASRAEALLAGLESSVSSVGQDEAQNTLAKAVIRYGRTQGVQDAGASLAELELLLRVFEPAGDGELLAMTLNRLGTRCAASGRIVASEEYYGRALTVLQAYPSDAWATELRAIVRGNRGINANRLRRHGEAAAVLVDALGEVTQLRDLATATMELAIAKFYLGDVESAGRLGGRAQHLAARLFFREPVAESDPDWERATLPGIVAKLDSGETGASTEEVQ